MSRIGNRVLTIPAGVEVNVDGNKVTVKGPKGTLEYVFRNSNVSVMVEDGKVSVTRKDDSKVSKQLHGTTNSNINNMLIGVSEGFKKELEIRGIGYRANMSGDAVILHIGYSHDITISPVPGSKISFTSATEIVVEGISKQAVGETAARIHDSRPPEPYQGKGIRYKGEYVRRKEGKTAGKK